jgi:hypothetical protein
LESDDNLYINTNTKFWKELITYVSLIRHGPHGKNASKYSIVACIRCSGIVFTEYLPSSYRGTHKLMEGFYEVQMGSIVMIQILSFIKIGSDIQKLTGGRGYQTQHGDVTTLLSFFLNNNG